MPVICPTVTAFESHTYRTQLERIERFAKRIHLDFMDGIFAPTRSVLPVQAYWPPAIQVDMHIMYQKPGEQIDQLIHMGPDLVILHAEADGELLEMFTNLAAAGISTGVALLQSTGAKDAQQLIEAADHVLIFSGDLGKFGGKVDETLFSKIREVKGINPSAEIGWDGGVNEDNAELLTHAGVDVLNVGSAIQKADNPQVAYGIIEGKIHQ